MASKEKTPALLGLTTQIVAAHLSRNELAAAELPDFIRRIHESLTQIATLDCNHRSALAAATAVKGRWMH